MTTINRHEQFTAFFKTRYKGLLRRAYFFHSREQRGLAEDLTQETFLRLWKAWPDKHELIVGNPGYAVTTLQNVAATYWRRQTGRDSESSTTSDEIIQLGSAADFDDVREAVRKLPQQQREVVFLIYYRGLSPAEVAREMGLMPATVHNYHALAKKNLRKWLDTADDEEGRNGR